MLVFWRNWGIHNLLFWDFLTFSWNGKKYLKFVILWRVYQSACVQACLSRDTLEHTLHIQVLIEKLELRGNYAFVIIFASIKVPLCFAWLPNAFCSKILIWKLFSEKYCHLFCCIEGGLSNWSPKSNWFERV